jgi:hypothetical protein
VKVQENDLVETGIIIEDANNGFASLPAVVQTITIPTTEGEEGKEEREEKAVVNTAEESSVKEPQSNRWYSKKHARDKEAQLIAENEGLKQHLGQMQNLLHQSVDTGSFHYQTQMQSILEKAQDAFTAAIEVGDAKATAQAASDIARIQFEINDFKRSKPRDEPNEQSELREPTQEERLQAINESKIETVYDWLEDNPELHKNSPYYDKQLSDEILSYIAKIDRKLKSGGNAHYIATPGYLKLLDDYIDNIKYNRKKPTSVVGGVHSRSYGDNVVGPTSLTDKEKRAAAAFNMSEEKYLNYLKKYAREAKK